VVHTRRSFQAPGRVNLIGEHTDYNDGFVMPVAIEFSTRATVDARTDRKLVIQSDAYEETRAYSLDDGALESSGHWSDYVLGVAVTLERAGYRLSGADLQLASDVPIGAGLSSSAAVEVATALALASISGISLDPVEIAQLCQKAENEFVGMRCGIMDQMISSCGREGSALMLDCRSLEHTLLPLPRGLRVVICNTMIRHELAAGEYNRRRADCEAGVEQLRQGLPHVRALRDVSLEELAAHESVLPERVYRRCRHVVSENLRVAEAADALERNDADALGRLMKESHASLRDDYEVSCAELDLMVSLANAAPGLIGARMTGGGFGGSTVNLVEAGAVDAFRHTVSDAYRRETGIEPQVFVTNAAAGAREVAVA